MAEKYNFTQSLKGMEAFIANFEKNMQEINEKIPVMFLNSGDEAYLFKEKFEKIKIEDIYLTVPRVMLDITDSQIQIEQNSNIFNKIVYTYNNKLYEATVRYQSFEYPINLSVVTSNFIKAWEYFDIINSILSIDKPFTYEFLGNTFEGNYTLETVSMEKNQVEPSSASRNYVVKANVNLVLRLANIRYSTIKELDSRIFDPKNPSGMKVKFGIVPIDVDGTKDYTELTNPPENCIDCDE